MKETWKIRVDCFDCPYLELKDYVENECHKPENYSKICKKEFCPLLKKLIKNEH